ncbi:hypothetical protein [Rhodopirellula sp. P2]|nr:hypothetical protein [Rhodopirellula sp. P2]WDQ14581.1 hypothetical protein PSR62_13090 [Rhodopirellula sp. P2]
MSIRPGSSLHGLRLLVPANHEIHHFTVVGDEVIGWSWEPALH